MGILGLSRRELRVGNNALKSPLQCRADADFSPSLRAEAPLIIAEVHVPPKWRGQTCRQAGSREQ